VEWSEWSNAVVEGGRWGGGGGGGSIVTHCAFSRGEREIRAHGSVARWRQSRPFSKLWRPLATSFTKSFLSRLNLARGGGGGGGWGAAEGGRWGGGGGGG